MTKVMGCVAVTVVWKERERHRAVFGDGETATLVSIHIEHPQTLICAPDKTA